MPEEITEQPEGRDAGEKELIQQILSKNAGKNFVKRIITPEAYPEMDNGDGSVSSHSMSWSDDGQGHYYVYPTVVQRNDGAELERLEGKEAAEYAQEKKEFVEFDNAEEADWFSKRYKVVWDE